MTKEIVPMHPVIFLEPVVHLILGSALLTWSPFETAGVRLAVGIFFILSWVSGGGS